VRGAARKGGPYRDILGLSVPSGTHLCCFFHGVEERNAVVIPFLRAGLSAGAKCLGVL
jgi:hypothetical protein